VGIRRSRQSQVVAGPADEADPDAFERMTWPRRAVLVGVCTTTLALLSSCGDGPPSPSVTRPAPSRPAPVPTVPTTTSSTALPEQPGPPPGQSLQFVNNEDGWLIARQHTVLASTDGGYTWHASYAGPDQPRVVDFVGPDDGWVIADTSDSFAGPAVLLHSTDGGDTWTNLGEPTGQVLAAIEFTGSTTGWALTTAGTLLATGDGGAHWSTVAAPAAASMCVAAGRLWLGTTAGAVEDSIDSGTSWQVSLSWAAVPRVPATSGTFGQGRMVAPWLSCSGSDAWALYDWGESAGSALYVGLATTDDGGHWSPFLGDYPSGPLHSLPDMSNTPAADGVSAAGSAWFLGDCGPCQTWGTVKFVAASGTSVPIAVSVPDVSFLNLDASFADEERGWIVGTEGSAVLQPPPPDGDPLDVLTTTDGGHSWRTIATVASGP
jgi:photosystem II stability/assembly factor-like uncharacterized protein